MVEALVTRRARLRESPLATPDRRASWTYCGRWRRGSGNAGIAAQLSLSESSVEKHVNAIFTKLGLTAEQPVHRRVAAVLTFLRESGLSG